MICTAASFVVESDAEHTRRELAKRKFPPVQIYLCGKCDRYHFRGSSQDLRIWRTMARVARLCALGFDATTIAEMAGYTRNTVQKSLTNLRQEFGALNLPHLIATMIALGYLDPNEFIPPVVDKERCERG